MANESRLDVDPDGLHEAIDRVIAEKLTTDTGVLLSSPAISDGSADLSFILEITVIDIYNFLLNSGIYDHATLRQYQKWKATAATQCFIWIMY